MQWVKGLLAPWVQPEFWLTGQKIYALRLAEAQVWETIKGWPTLGHGLQETGRRQTTGAAARGRDHQEMGRDMVLPGASPLD
jgi:hypothetical protein